MTGLNAIALGSAVAGRSAAMEAMGKTDPKQPGDPQPAGAKDDDADRAFDLWLRRGLHQLYDTVAKEPVPDALLQLIEEDRKARDK